MFNGIIETLGKITGKSLSNENIDWTIQCPFANELKEGESVAINGACHTVTKIHDNAFETTSMKETLEITNLRRLEITNPVNLERSMIFGDRVHGHMVQGHIDGTAEVISIENKGDSHRFTFQTSPEIMKYVVYKGSTAINGVSLTISHVEDSNNQFSVDIIPYTFEHTNFQYLKEKDLVNIETDMMARYRGK